MKKILLFPVLALLLSCTNEAEQGEILLKIDSLEAELDRLKTKNDSLEKELDLLKNRNPVVFSEAFDTMDDPETFIIESLEGDTELIPEESVLGGTMRFIDSEILNERFVWAAYEDGHIAGEAIYQYELNETDSINFKLISEIKD